MKANEKQLAVNMVIAEVSDVQKVTTRPKGKVAEWENQEEILMQATEWIRKANERNMAEIEDQNVQSEEADKHTEDDPTWQALQECQIVLPLGQLLQLVPQFTAGLKTIVIEPNPKSAPEFFSNLKEGPAVVDTSSPAITVIVKGKEIAGTIIDGFSG